MQNDNNETTENDNNDMEIAEADAAETEDNTNSTGPDNSNGENDTGDEMDDDEISVHDENPEVNPGLNTTSPEVEGLSKTEVHAAKIAACWKKIRELTGEKVEVTSQGTVVTWTVVDNIDPPVTNAPSERPNLGLTKTEFWVDRPLNQQ